MWKKRLIQKSKQSICKFKISAVAFTTKGNFLDSTINFPRFNRRGGGLHAEMVLMKRHGKRIGTIIICRVGRSGIIRPISPCPNCQKIANKMGIRIKTIKDE